MDKDKEIQNFKDQLLQANFDIIRASKNEEEQGHTIEWYEAQVQELRVIRKMFYDIFGDTADGKDAYFPDLLKKEIERLRNGRVIND